jgi:hypothetical protein
MQASLRAGGEPEERVRSRQCRLCQVTKVWDTFAKQLFPLLRAIEVPVRLRNLQGEARVKELKKIQQESLKWLQNYVDVYGDVVTPYVHTVGRHLHEMLDQDPNYGIGAWSQQGFEACHKLIRRVYNNL